MVQKQAREVDVVAHGKSEKQGKQGWEGRQGGHHSTVGKGNTLTADRPTTALRFY